MSRNKEIEAAVRRALAGEAGVEVVPSRDGIDVYAHAPGVEGADWEIHVPVLLASGPGARPVAAFTRADGGGFYHAVAPGEAPAALRARAEALVGRIASGAVALAGLDDRAAGLVGALADLVRAHDLGDEETLERALAAARALAAPFRPEVAEAPAAGPAPRAPALRRSRRREATPARPCPL